MNYSKIYLSDLLNINHAELDWNKLEGKCVLITGATGLIGSVIVDAIMYRNQYLNGNIKVLVLSRNEERILDRFHRYMKESYFVYISQDVSQKLTADMKIDYIIHAASKGNPKSFVEDPVGVMNANYIGMYNMLELAREKNVEKIIYLSSGEIYGRLDEIKDDGIEEKDYGYLDILNPRNCYASSKRAAETLCASYYQKHKVDFSIARLCHVYGASYLQDEDRVIFQFIQKGLQNESIVMKSEGLQKRSYCYVADAVKAIFFLLLKGQAGEAYNIANPKSVTTIRNLADTIAEVLKVDIKMEAQTTIEKRGNSAIEYAVLNSSKLMELGWKAENDLVDGIKKTVNIIYDK